VTRGEVGGGWALAGARLHFHWGKPTEVIDVGDPEKTFKWSPRGSVTVHLNVILQNAIIRAFKMVKLACELTRNLWRS